MPKVQWKVLEFSVTSLFTLLVYPSNIVYIIWHSNCWLFAFLSHLSELLEGKSWNLLILCS